MTIVITAVADGGGRKMLLISGAVLMAIAGWVFAVSTNPIFLCSRRYLWHHQSFGKRSRTFSLDRTSDSPADHGGSTANRRLLRLQIYELVLGAMGALAVGWFHCFHFRQSRVTGF